MQGNLAQWTGIAVTSIVVLGSDIDVVYAVPLGILAGALATLFSSLADAQSQKLKAKAVPPDARPLASKKFG